VTIKASLLPPLRRTFSRDEIDKLFASLLADVGANPDLKSQKFRIGLRNAVKSINSKQACAVLLDSQLPKALQDTLSGRV